MVQQPHLSRNQHTALVCAVRICKPSCLPHCKAKTTAGALPNHDTKHHDALCKVRCEHSGTRDTYEKGCCVPRAAKNASSSALPAHTLITRIAPTQTGTTKHTAHPNVQRCLYTTATTTYHSCDATTEQRLHTSTHPEPQHSHHPVYQTINSANVRSYNLQIQAHSHRVVARQTHRLRASRTHCMSYVSTHAVCTANAGGRNF
jgi:hypothetical protein